MKRRGAVVGVALLALGGAASAFTAFALWSGSFPVVGWMRNNPGFNDTISGSVALQNAALTAAASTWSTKGCSRCSFTFLGDTTTANVALDGQQVVMTRDSSSGNALATTFSWTSG